jgi:hypothetical protein
MRKRKRNRHATTTTWLQAGDEVQQKKHYLYRRSNDAADKKRRVDEEERREMKIEIGQDYDGLVRRFRGNDGGSRVNEESNLGCDCTKSPLFEALEKRA